MGDFGDGIDWSAEARRAAAEDVRLGLALPIGRSEMVERLTELLPGRGRILDAGCNIGRYCPILLAAGFSYHGVDQSAEALSIASERNPTGQFSESLLWDMAFAEQFDAAISMAVLQHNTLDEKQRILPRIAAAIRPGGLFVMSESTVLEETRTQLTQEGWIRLVISHGFELLSTWHPNPEHGIDDAYMFRRGERLAKAPKRPK